LSFFFQAEDGIRDFHVTGVQTCALPISSGDLPEQVLAWRGEIARGALFGPRLLTSGAKIEGIAPLWKGTIEVGNEADVDAALDQIGRASWRESVEKAQAGVPSKHDKDTP